MWIIDVIPIKRAIGAETLSYFTGNSCNEGDLVSVPIRGKNTKALVVSVKNVEDNKSSIKSASFELKKVEGIEAKNFLSKEFMNSAIKTADFFAASTGSTLSSLIPKIIQEESSVLGNSEIEDKNETAKEKTNPAVKFQEKYIIQGDDEERYSSYKSIIRQSFAKKTSVFIVLPTEEEINYVKSILEKGIEDYTVTIHNGIKNKALKSSIKKILSDTHPLLIICTPAFLSVLRPDTSVIIVEKANSRHYKTQRRPYLDMRVFAEYLAEELKIEIIFGDSILPIELLWKESNGDYKKGEPLKWRIITTAGVHISDMTSKAETDNSGNGGKDNVIFGNSLKSLILKNKEENERLLLIVGRKGLSPLTICGDCQKPVLCNKCFAPVVLYPSVNNPEKTYFMCHHCGDKRSSTETCKTCNSWNLKSFGIGIDLVEKHIKEFCPEINIFRIDKDTCIKPEKAKAEAEKFLKSPGTVLIGTEMSLQYIREKIENTAIVSLDSILSLPDFRASERLFNILTKIRGITSKAMVIQSRQTHLKIFEYAGKGNILEYYKEEIAARKIVNYPPFSILIKITLRGKKDIIIKEMEEVQNILDTWNVDVFPSFTHTMRGEYILHGLIKVPVDKWPNDDLLSKLRALPLSAEVRVDPETLL